MNRRQFNISTAMTLIASMLPIPAMAKAEYPKLEVIDGKEYMITEKPLFLPDISYGQLDYDNRIIDRKNKWTTIVHTGMFLLIRTLDGAKVFYSIPNHKYYKEWVAKYWDKEIPPHISFGGAIKSIPSGDSSFKSRWEKDILSKIRNGELA